MKRVTLFVLVANFCVTTIWAESSQRSRYREDDRSCRVSDMKEYYGHKLSTKYDTRRAAKEGLSRSALIRKLLDAGLKGRADHDAELGRELQVEPR